MRSSSINVRDWFSLGCAVNETRGIALFFSIFVLINVVGGWIRPAFDSSIWILDLRMLPRSIASAVLVLGALAMLWHGLGVGRNFLQRSRCGLVTIWAILALANAAMVWRLSLLGDIQLGWPIPFSILLAIAFAAIAWQSWRPTLQPARPLRIVAALVASLIAFPLCNIGFYGQTHYERRVDAIVVLGAKVFKDGTPSDVLADRVRTGCALYKEHVADHLILSGGPGDGAISEPQAMKNLALSLGVPDSAITLDEDGLSTSHTVSNLDPHRHYLAVSTGYHLPRIKLEAEQLGLVVYTTPATETRTLRRWPIFVAREVVAWWAYWIGLK